jgi:hypothetical protein
MTDESSKEKVTLAPRPTHSNGTYNQKITNILKKVIQIIMVVQHQAAFTKLLQKSQVKFPPFLYKFTLQATAAVFTPDASYAEYSLEERKPVTKEEKNPIISRTADADLLILFEGPRNHDSSQPSQVSQLRISNTRNWNDEFQSILDMDDTKEKFVKLRNLGNFLIIFSFTLKSTISSTRQRLMEKLLLVVQSLFFRILNFSRIFLTKPCQNHPTRRRRRYRRW